MLKTWHAQAWDDYLKWHDLDIGRWRKINDLLKDMERHPFIGAGKPEQLKKLWGPQMARATMEHGTRT
jgi:toxin YoeB